MPFNSLLTLRRISIIISDIWRRRMLLLLMMMMMMMMMMRLETRQIDDDDDLSVSNVMPTENSLEMSKLDR